MTDVPWETYAQENEAVQAAIPVVTDDYDTLRDLIVSYGAARFISGHRLATGNGRYPDAVVEGDRALTAAITLLNRLQRTAGGGL